MTKSKNISIVYIFNNDNDQSSIYFYLKHLNFQIGHFEYFDQTNQQYLSTRLATFYEHLSTGSQSGESTFTVPYVDPFSGVGMYIEIKKENTRLYMLFCHYLKKCYKVNSYLILAI